MLRRVHLLLAYTLLVVQVSMAQKLVTPGYLFNSDPTCREIDGQFYLFTTQDPFTTQLQTDNKYFKGMYAYHALSTTDFDHWVDHGSIRTSRDVFREKSAALWAAHAGVPTKSQLHGERPLPKNSTPETKYRRLQVGDCRWEKMIGTDS